MHCTSITSYNECLTPAVWNFPKITRPFSIIYYVLGGSAFYTIDGTERSFEKNHLYILPANREFSLREDPNDKFYSVYIHAFISPEINSVVDIETENDPFLLEILNLIRKYSKNKNSTYLWHLTDLLLSYIYYIPSASESSLPVKLRNYIESNYIDVFKGADLAGKFSYSRSYLTKIFKDKYNVTPKQYAKQMILKEAVSLLNKGFSVGQISEQLVFSSPENFCRLFKECYGFPPSQYAKQFKNFPD